MKNVQTLISDVIDQDYCIGCGACAFLEGSPFRMQLNNDGKYQPIIDSNSLKTFDDKNILDICPFSNNSVNEDVISKEIFGVNKNYEPVKHIGYYMKNYAGYVKEGSLRENGSSGGMGTWILKELLKNKEIDSVIHVRESENKDNSLFEFSISESENEILRGAKSRYYPVEMSEVLKIVEAREGNYAVVGIPCFIKAVRLLMRKNEKLKSRIKFCISLVCGHLKSSHFAKSIGWEMGINPSELSGINFRHKIPGENANEYGMKAEGYNKESNVHYSEVRLKKDTMTTNWGHGYFKYNACEYCDDVLGETADLTIGDAWLPQYLNESEGTNLIIIRNRIILELIESAHSDGRLVLDELSEDEVVLSQKSGIVHRTEGLSYRLFLKDSKGEKRPNKRTLPSNNISSKRKLVYKARLKLMDQSFIAYRNAIEKNDFKVFSNQMKQSIIFYKYATSKNKGRFVLSAIKSLIKG